MLPQSSWRWRLTNRKNSTSKVPSGHTCKQEGSWVRRAAAMVLSEMHIFGRMRDGSRVKRTVFALPVVQAGFDPQQPQGGS